MKNFILCLSLMALSLSAYAYEVGQTVQDPIIPHMTANGEIVNKRILEGESVSQYKVIEFFLTTCPVCNDNRPIFNRLAKEFKGQVLFKLVGIDRPNRANGRPETLLGYIAAHRAELPFDLGLDYARTAYARYGVFETPTLYVINGRNEVVYKHSHQIINKRAELEIKNILQEK